MTIDQWIKEALRGGERVSIDYQEGGFFSADKVSAFIKYNTGDCVWFQCVDGIYQIQLIDTHDGLVFKII